MMLSGLFAPLLVRADAACDRFKRADLLVWMAP
jgi:hypothetical protein